MNTNIKYIIDVDGFSINRRFMVKELAILDLETEQIHSMYYKVGHYNDLDFKQKFDVNWVRKHVHGLWFEDYPEDELQANIFPHILKFCTIAEAENKVIGYKGGIYELNILNSVGYSHLAFNIEDVGCPSIKMITENNIGYWNVHINKIKCNRHDKYVYDKKTNKKQLAHCPRAEVFCFYRYLCDNNLCTINKCVIKI